MALTRNCIQLAMMMISVIKIQCLGFSNHGSNQNINQSGFPEMGGSQPYEHLAPPGNRKLDPMKDMSAEKLLLNTLLYNYHRVGRPGRPVLNVSTTTEVIFALGLIQMDLDERNKILTMSMWTRYQWRDEYLTWDPRLYDGIQAIRVEPHMIWIPDITLYNTADADAPARAALAVISSDGVVTWYPHTIFKSSCSIDVTNFPFDRQQCHMWFGSWTYTSREIDLRMDVNHGIDLSTFKSDYKESSAWDIINVDATRRIMPTEQDDPNYVVLMFDISMKRKLVFSSYILTLPCIFLAFLTLVVFWLPAERPDRTGLAMSTFSSFMLLLLILVEAAPPTASTIPTLGVYYCFNLVLIMLSIILSSLVVNISRGSNKHVPGWLHMIVYGIVGRILCLTWWSAINVRIHNKRGLTGTINEGEAESMTMVHTQSEALQNNMHGLAQSQNIRNEVNYYENIPESVKCLLKGIDQQTSEIRQVLQKMEIWMEETSSKDKTSSEIKSEWKRIAMILDRFFFIIYILLIIISLSWLFPKPT